MRLTIAVPQAHIDNANHLAMVLGYSEADGLTYRNPSWQDAQGNLYAVASLPVSDGFIVAAESPVVRPEWDTEEVIDMTKAAQAQELVSIWTLDSSETGPKATPDVIKAVLGMGGGAAIEAVGLTPVPQDDGVL